MLVWVADRADLCKHFLLLNCPSNEYNSCLQVHYLLKVLLIYYRLHLLYWNIIYLSNFKRIIQSEMKILTFIHLPDVSNLYNCLSILWEILKNCHAVPSITMRQISFAYSQASFLMKCESSKNDVRIVKFDLTILNLYEPSGVWGVFGPMCWHALTFVQKHLYGLSLVTLFATVICEQHVCTTYACMTINDRVF